MADWHEFMTRTIGGILARPHVRVLVAADADATDHVADLFGWLVWMAREGQPPLVFYAYVKHAFRFDPRTSTGPRIASRLFRHAGIDPKERFDFACQTHIVGSLKAAGKIRNAEWRPLAGRFPNERGLHGKRYEADAA